MGKTQYGEIFTNFPIIKVRDKKANLIAESPLSSFVSP